MRVRRGPFRRRTSGRAFARLLLVLIVALLSAEIGLRLLAPLHAGVRGLLWHRGLRTTYDSIETLEELLARSPFGWRPGTEWLGFVTNSRSMRTREYARTKEPGTVRVLTIGDSFTFDSGGVPHATHWPVRLEALLRERLDRPVEVLSLAAPSVGPLFERRLWQLEGRHLGADLVVLAFCTGNDFLEDSQSIVAPPWDEVLAADSFAFRLARNLVRLRGTAAHAPAPGTMVARRQASGTRVTGVADEPGRAVSAIGVPVPGYAFDSSAPRFARREFLDIVTHRMALCDVTEQGEEWFDLLLKGVGQALAAMRDDVRAAGASFVVVAIPEEHQVVDALWREGLAHSGRSSEQFDRDRPQRRLAALLDELVIPSLDLLPAFRDAARQGATLYNVQETHWNEEGNRVAAEAIARFLLRDGSLEDPIRS